MSGDKPQRIAAALQALAAMGLSVKDLADAPAAKAEARAGPTADTPRGRGPLVADYVDRVLPALPPGSQRTYRPPLRFLAQGWSVPISALPLIDELAAEVGLDVPTGPPAVTAPRPAKAQPRPGTSVSRTCCSTRALATEPWQISTSSLGNFRERHWGASASGVMHARPTATPAATVGPLSPPSRRTDESSCLRPVWPA